MPPSLIETSSSDRFISRVAQRFHVALGAFRFPGVADSASVPDQLVGKLDPFVPRNDLHQILLDLLRIFIARQIQAVRKTQHVRIHYHSAGDSIRGAEHDVSRFSRNTGQREYLFHRARHLPAELFNDGFAGSHYGLGFVPEKSRRTNVLFQFAWGRKSERLRIRILLIERFSNLIHAHVRALRGKNRGDQQLKCILMLQLARRIPVSLVQSRKDCSYSLWISPRSVR